MTSKQLLFNRPIPQGWQMLTVDEIKANEPRSCVAGPFGSSISSKYFVPEGVPVIRGNNLTDNLTPFVPHGFAFVSEEKAESFKAQQVKGGDLVFTCWGTLGQVGLIPYDGPYPTYIISNKQLKLRPNLEICEPRFLYYYFASPQMVQHIRNVAIGAAVPGINLGILKSLQVVLPPLPIQRKIVGILSAYDDLIENNRRRIEILEEMARSLYREWFVNFRFPGHEQVKMVDSELGLIPEGWEVKPVEDLLSYHIGGGWGEEEQSNQYPVAAYVIRGTDIPLARLVSVVNCPLRFHKKSNFKSRKLELGDIVFEVSGGSKGQPVGRALLITQKLIRAFDSDIICASFCKLLRVNKKVILPELLYLHLLNIYSNGRIDKYQVQSTGITNFKFAFFLESEKLLVPLPQWQAKFNKIAIPIFESIQTLGAKNTNLRQTRDLLLPKLISGEIDVENLDIKTGETAA